MAVGGTCHYSQLLAVLSAVVLGVVVAAEGGVVNCSLFLKVETGTRFLSHLSHLLRRISPTTTKADDSMEQFNFSSTFKHNCLHEVPASESFKLQTTELRTVKSY